MFSKLISHRHFSRYLNLMIYFCDIKVNSLPNQKLLYENFLYIISDACMFTYLIKPKIRKAVFRIIKKNFLIYSRKKERMVMVLLSSLVPRNHRSLANQKTEVIIFFHNFRLPHLIQ